MLVIGHLSSALAAGVEHARAVHGNAAAIDVLGYGRVDGATPMPPRTRVLGLATSGGLATRLRSAGALARRLVRTPYTAVVVCQAGFAHSRGRGALLAAAAIASPRIAAIDPAGKDPAVPRSRVYAAADAARFAVAQAVCAAAMPVMAMAVARWGRVRAAAGSFAAPQAGTVVYLRSDLELAHNGLSAGGSLAHTHGVIEALRRRGHRVELWSTGDIAGTEHLPRRRLPAAAFANLPAEAAELLSFAWQRARFRRRPAEVTAIYQRYSLNNLLGVALARRWGVPLILEANASEVRWRTEWSALKYPAAARATEQAAFLGADRMRVVSENAANEVRAAGAPAARVRVVPNGVDVERFTEAKPRRLPFEDDAFVVAFCGLFYPWHGVVGLAQSFCLLHGAVPDARLLLIGDGEDAAAALESLRRGGAFDAAHITGLVPSSSVPGWLQAVDVLVAPHVGNRNFVGSPIKIFEYLASGRAIVATRVAQIEEILRHEETALLVPPDDPRALAGALERLAGDPELRHRLGTAAREDARRRHSWEARLADAFAPDV